MGTARKKLTCFAFRIEIFTKLLMYCLLLTVQSGMVAASSYRKIFTYMQTEIYKVAQNMKNVSVSLSC